MHLKLYKKFLEDFYELVIDEQDGDFIKEGRLIDKKNKNEFPIINYIPRFTHDDYCESFALQWQKYRNLQLDSRSGYSHSYNRLVNNTHWPLAELGEKTVLECGCGPGRFTEIFLAAGAVVVAVDMSVAIDVNFENNGKNERLLLLQGNINEMPFFANIFDYVFCYGVLQHTPEPEKTFHNLTKYLNQSGSLSIDIYRKTLRPTPYNFPKYFWRPLTKRMNKDLLLKIIKWYIPKWIKIDTVIRRIPKFGGIILGLIPIPCWNYVHLGYSEEERIQHAIMDTFDALSPAYDFPKTRGEVKRWFAQHAEFTQTEVFLGSNGIVGNAGKIGP